MSAPTPPNPNALALILEECAFCHTPARDQQLHFCSGCRSRKYCNEECQRAAWAAGHKKECKKLKAFKLKASRAAGAASAPRDPSGEGGGRGSGSPAEAKTTKKEAENPYEKTTNGPAASTSEPNTSDTTNIAPAPTTLPDEDDAPKGKKKTGASRSAPAVLDRPPGHTAGEELPPVVPLQRRNTRS